jgi:hypothetical protein
MSPLCGTQDGARYWVNLEPCGLICALITYLLIAYGQYATTFCIVFPLFGSGILGVFNILFFNFFSLLSMYCHFKGWHLFLIDMLCLTNTPAMTTDPGSVPKTAYPLPDDDEENDYESGTRFIL